MKIAKIVAAIIAGGIAVTSSAHAAGIEGNWKRKNGDMVNVSVNGGKLYCKITSGSKPGFEMCNGMGGGGNEWASKKMKHPRMPGMMSFNGSVKVSGKGLSIKGCAIGQSMCDEETWTRAN